MAGNEGSTKGPIIIHPVNFLMAGFCFVAAIMSGKLGDHFVYYGQLSITSAAIITLLLLGAGAGYLIGVIEIGFIEVKS